MLPDSKVLDAPPHRVSIEQTVEMARDFELLVLFTSTPGFEVDCRIAQMMKDSNPKLKVCFVGPPVTMEPEKSLNASSAIDFIIRREFDYQIADLRRGIEEEIRRAILSHANHLNVKRETPLEKTLYACDELAGFITAISYVKPHRSVFEVDTASVKKKMKDKAFARSVNRQDIIDGAQELGVPLDEHIEFCVKAMQARAEDLGLKGTMEAGA